MPTISQTKKQTICQHILDYLFKLDSDSAFTATISKAIARDEEFTKALLAELKARNMVVEININPNGIEYTKRQRWRLSARMQEVYRKNELSNDRSD